MHQMCQIIINLIVTVTYHLQHCHIAQASSRKGTETNGTSFLGSCEGSSNDKLCSPTVTTLCLIDITLQVGIVPPNDSAPLGKLHTDASEVVVHDFRNRAHTMSDIMRNMIFEQHQMLRNRVKNKLLCSHYCVVKSDNLKFYFDHEEVCIKWKSQLKNSFTPTRK